MRLIEQNTNFWPFSCGFDLVLAHTILQTIRVLASTLLNSQHTSYFAPKSRTICCTFLSASTGRGGGWFSGRTLLSFQGSAHSPDPSWWSLGAVWRPSFWLFSPPSSCCDGASVRAACNNAFWANKSSTLFYAWANCWFRLAILASGPMDSASSSVLFWPGLVRYIVTIMDFFFKGTMSGSHRRRQTVGTVFGMVTCRLVICHFLPECTFPQTYKNNKQLVGVPTTPFWCLSQFQLVTFYGESKISELREYIYKYLV
jgi:hypothetical protein